MVFVQVGPFTDNVSTRNQIRFPFTSGRWRVYYIGTAGMPSGVAPQIGDLRIQTLPNICVQDPTNQYIIQTEVGAATVARGANRIQPNQLLAISSGTSNMYKHFAEPWCIGEIDANECQTMIFTTSTTAGGARYFTLWFDCYRID